MTPWSTVFSSDYTLPSLASFESWKIILGYGCALFATQFTETAIALNVVDRLDESQGPGFRVLIGQGIANAVSAICGGMGGSGVVSMSVLADRTFGTTCLSTFMTGFMMFIFITWGHPVINFIPLSAISGISIAMVCSFIQWRSMVATFTTCLPTSKRDQLSPQYNIARFDVCVMLFVTAGCLIMDLATLLFFVMGLGIFVYGWIQASCCGGKKEENDQSQSGLEEFLEEDYEDVQHDQDIEAAQTDERAEQSFPVQDNKSEVRSTRSTGEEEEGCPSWDCRVMDTAEEVIFPQSSRNKRGSKRNQLS